MAHEHRNSADPYQQSNRQSHREPLCPKDENFRHCHEHRDGGQHDRSEARRHTLLSPEQQAVIEDKDQNRKQRRCTPLPKSRRTSSLQPHPPVENNPGGQETHAREQKWRHFAHADADRQKGRPPNKIDNREGEQHLPRARLRGLFHEASRVRNANNPA